MGISNRIWVACGLLVGVLSGSVGCSTQQLPPVPPADTVYSNGVIYSVDANNSTYQAFAVRDGAIIAIGTDAQMDPLVGDATQVVDLVGRFVMPGIQDMHMHPVDGGIKGLYE